MENEKYTDSEKKSLRTIKALSVLEGVFCFVAGVCALMAGSTLGYISGGLLIALACMNLVPVFIGGNEYFITIGTSLAEDEDVHQYAERVEENKE